MAVDQAMVIYRPIPGWPDYRVGDDGSVWSCRRRNGLPGAAWRCLKLRRLSRTGYCQVTLYPGGAQLLVHRLVLLAFVGPCPDGMECRHMDGNRCNNVPDNLCWGTPAENAADKRLHGTMARGERNGTAILDETRVQAIRLARATTAKTLKQIGQEHGVSLHAVWVIVHRRKWAHVD